MEKVFLALTASDVRDKVKADIDVGLKYKAEGADAGGAPHDGHQETRNEAAGESKPKSLARMQLKNSDDDDCGVEQLQVRAEPEARRYFAGLAL